MTDLLSVVSEAERNSFPTVSQLSENDVDSIWSNVSSFVERQMTLQKGVYIPGLGTFTFSQQKLDLNFTALSVESPFERHVVEGCVRETLLVLLRAVAAGRSVLFTVHAIGELSFCQSKVKMKFYHDFGPGTSNTIILPKISSEQRGKDWGEEAPAQVQTNSDRKEENGDAGSLDLNPGPAVKGSHLTLKPPAVDTLLLSTVSILPLQGAALKQGKVKRGDSHLDVPCVDHNRAGQELCYLCMQRAQRNIPHYLAEERLREQQEEERVLLLNEQRRDQCYLQREQADRLEKRENNQKVAAFNLGVSEAMKEKKVARSSHFHGSYIFGGRPLTPPRVHKQRGYMKDLRAQAEWREDQQLHLKQKNTSCYKKSLDIQVECQGTGLPARQPDSDGPVFGQLDCTPAGLSEQRQRAEKVYQEQLTTANNKRKEQLLNRCTKQKNEREMLNRNRKDLLIDQCEQYRRCYQCKRKTENCGETNIWKESHYMPGSRLMV
ncbi:unnamed protein product, partial [Coregonus sp. 'balchen']